MGGAGRAGGKCWSKTKGLQQPRGQFPCWQHFSVPYRGCLGRELRKPWYPPHLPNNKCHPWGQFPYLSLRGASTVGCPLGRVWWERGGETLGGAANEVVVAAVPVRSSPSCLTLSSAGCPEAPSPFHSWGRSDGHTAAVGEMGVGGGKLAGSHHHTASHLAARHKKGAASSGVQGGWQAAHLAGGSAGARKPGWAAG